MKKIKLNIQMFASTNKTTNYELPQFIGTDKPSWLGDINEAMSTIDGGMHKNATDIESLSTDVDTAITTSAQASQDVSDLTATVGTLSTNLQSVETTANNASTTASSALNTANTKISKNDLLSFVYPVGSIYMSINSTSPASFLGGTWELIKGKFLVGIDNNDTTFNTLGNTGGEKTHTLTINEMPSHTHNAFLNADQSCQPYANGAQRWPTRHIDNAHANMIQSTGGGQAHNNLPPYLVVSIWKRTA